MTRVDKPTVSFVLATHNRCEVVAHTLAQVWRCGLDQRDYEVIVVDNASTDSTSDAVASLADCVVRLRVNAGSCAKAFGVECARGTYIVFLDDDSYPRPGSVERMIKHFEDNPKLGAAGFSVHLPDGRREGSALPGVFVGCGVGFRAEALGGVGGLDRGFFMQAEEYDLSFRLVNAGWDVQVFGDLHVEHLKTVHARRSDRTAFLDVRNNLRVAARYLPRAYFGVYRRDWLQRYRWMAEREGHRRAFRRGARAGRWHGTLDRWTHRSRRLLPQAFERFFQWETVYARMGDLASSGVRRIVLADLGKNVYAYHQAADRAGINVLAIGDDRFCASGRHYRGHRIVPFMDALDLDPDAVVISNMAAVHATVTSRRLKTLTRCAVHDWFGEPENREGDELPSEHAGELAAVQPT